MNSKDIALKIAKILDDKKGLDIFIIDIATKSSFADYFILASGANERQIGALANEVEDELAKDELLVKNIEGKKESGWILMDYGDIIVNVLTVEMRERYHIEKVWGDCDTVPTGLEG
ncbi:MAG: ribosome silencing factor [Anaerovoracaceae bacterium]